MEKIYKIATAMIGGYLVTTTLIIAMHDPAPSEVIGNQQEPVREQRGASGCWYELHGSQWDPV